MSSSDRSSSIEVQVETKAHDELVSLVESITFGTEGLRYQRLNVAAQLTRFNAPVFFHAFFKGKLAGVYVLDKRDLLLSGEPVTGYYRGVLAVVAKHQRKGIGRVLTRHAMAWMAQQADALQSVSYGCIDKDNTRSLNLLMSMGAKRLSGLSMNMMYHQWPRQRCDLQCVDERDVAEKLALKQLVVNSFSESGLVDVSESTLPVFKLEDAEGVVICATAAFNRFRIVEMGKAARWCTRLFVQPFSQARKRFNPDDFKHVSLSGVYIRPGSEKKWRAFVSTVLSHYHCHFAATYVHPKARLFQQLQQTQFSNRFIHSPNTPDGDIFVMLSSTDKNEQLTSLDEANTTVSVWPVDA